MTHTVNRRRLLAGATATTAWLAAPALVRAQSQALKIAVLLPRSGYLAQAGQSCHRGAQIAGKVLSDFGYRVQNGGAVFRVRLSEHDPNRSMLPVGYNAYILA